MRPSVLSALACTLLLSLANCGGDDSPTNDSTGYGDGTQQVNIDTAELKHSSGGSSWTILVYMVADNNLEPFALLDIEEMMNVGSNDNFHIVLEVDRAPGYTDDAVGGIANFEDAKRFLVKKGSLQELDDLGEINTGDPAKLADFVSWGAKAYPADKIGIVLWDHGAAWPGFGADETSNFDGLTLTELAKGFSDGLGATDKTSFNFIGFDACLMGSLETALALRPFGEYLVGSEELEPGHGWDYTGLANAASKTSSTAVDVGKNLIDAFKAQANSSTWKDGDTITLSLVDLYNLKALERDIRDLQAAYKDGDANGIARQRASTLEFGVQQNPADSAGMVDLALFASAIKDNVASLATPAGKIPGHVTSAVVYSTAGSALAKAKGLSVYWPQYATYYNNDYEKLTQMTYWRKFLDSVQGVTGSASGGIEWVTTDLQPQSLSQYPGQYFFFGQVTQASVSSIVAQGLYYGIYDASSGGGLLFGDSSGVLADGSTPDTSPPGVLAAWDFKLVFFTQGAKKVPVYFSYQLTDDGGSLASIPFTYVPPSGQPQDVFYVTVYDASQNVTQQTFYSVTQAGYGELQPVAGAKLYPEFIFDDGSSLQYVTSYQFDGKEAYELDLSQAIGSEGLAFSDYATGEDAFVLLYAQDPSGSIYPLTWHGSAP